MIWCQFYQHFPKVFTFGLHIQTSLGTHMQPLSFLHNQFIFAILSHLDFTTIMGLFFHHIEHLFIDKYYKIKTHLFLG